MRKHLGLSLFLSTAAFSTYGAYRGTISTPLYIAIVGAAYLGGMAITNWGAPGELHINLWKEMGFVWKIRERAEFVAAKAAEVQELDNRIRQTISKFVEFEAFSVNFRNQFPQPPIVRSKIESLLQELATLAFPDIKQKEEFIATIKKEMQISQAIRVHPITPTTE